MRKLSAYILVSTMIFSLVGCGNVEETSQDTTSNEIVSSEEGVEESETAEITEVSYKLTDTGQSVCYDNEGNIIEPEEGDEYYGQDADYVGTDFSFTDNGDGTVTDNVTGLTWIQIPISEKMSWEEAVEYCENLEFAGRDDWRIPTAKELFGISDFESGWPFIDTDYFGFPEESSEGGPPGDGGPTTGESMEAPGSDKAAGAELGEEAAPPEGGEGAPPEGEEGAGGPPEGEGGAQAEGENAPPPEESSDSDSDEISKSQGQFWSSNFYYAGTTHNGAATAFGVNHATGHIKGYPSDVDSQMGKYVRAVCGEEVAVNDFVDNEDGTITDEATGLMWMQDDNGEGIEWDDALSYAENMEYAGYDDWRLPNVKELQSIVDYSGSYPAIDMDYFNITALEENENYYFWTSTSAYFSTELPGNGYAWYVAFGMAVDDEGEDMHGAGAVRFSPKYLDSSYAGEGGDNILNSVRLVRDISD